MLLAAERAQLVRYAQRLQPDDLSTGTAGNLSIRAGDLVAITPSGIPYDELEPASICVVGIGGAPVEGAARPSSELDLHLAVYRDHACGAVVHTHPLHATALSTVLDELPPVHYLCAELGGSVRVAPYALFGTPELAAAASRALAGRHAVLLEAHGAVTIGRSLAEAYARSVQLEWAARMYVAAAQVGRPKALSDEQVAAVAARLDELGYGATAGRGGRQAPATAEQSAAAAVTANSAPKPP